MDWGKIGAIVASAVVIAITAFALLGGSFGADTEGDANKAALDTYLDYQYDNADSYPTRLLILGNADMDDDIDEDDIELIRLVASGGYDYVENYFCDANYDGVIDDLDAEMVGELMLLDDYYGKVNYLNCDFKIRSYDMGMPLRTSNILTQTLEMLCILCPESVVAVDDRCSEAAPQGQYWREFASVLDYSKMGHVGSHKAPNAEKYLSVAREYGDGYLTAVMNSEYAQSTGYMERQLSNTTVQIVRVPSWERGGVCCGMLTLGFMFHQFGTATDWVTWHDGYYDDIMAKVQQLRDDERVKAVISVLGDTDISSLDKFQINYITSGEYQNLIRMGVIDVGGQYLKDKGLAASQWEVEISRESFIAMYTDYGLDYLIGTVPGPYNVSPLNPKNPSAQDNFDKVTKFLEDYCDGLPLQVIGWQYATGPMDITFLAMMAEVLYGWDYDLGKIVDEGLQWMHVYGTGEGQWTYETIKDTFLCPVLRGGDSMSKLKIRTKVAEVGRSVRLSNIASRKYRNSDTATASQKAVADYKAYRYAKSLMLILVALLCLVALGVDIGLGPYHIDFLDVYKAIFERLGDWGGVMTTDEKVVWDLRMPRVLTALFAGMGLAMAGAAMQSMMKNPLADPYTTGISSGAALGATLAMTLGIFLIPGTFGTVVNAFVFALIPAGFIIAMSIYRKPSPAMIILSGISLMYIFNAVQSYLMLVADPNAASSVYAWTIGSLNQASWDNLPFMFCVAMLGGIALMYMARVLNTMNSGDAYSKSIGINVNRARIIVLVAISVVAAGIVSFTGIIGFIGLVAPHIARIFVGSDNKILIPAAGLMGAGLMLLADCIVQTVAETMPIGIITSIIGGPVFMILILRQKKEIW